MRKAIAHDTKRLEISIIEVDENENKSRIRLLPNIEMDDLPEGECDFEDGWNTNCWWIDEAEIERLLALEKQRGEIAQAAPPKSDFQASVAAATQLVRETGEPQLIESRLEHHGNESSEIVELWLEPMEGGTIQREIRKPRS